MSLTSCEQSQDTCGYISHMHKILLLHAHADVSSRARGLMFGLYNHTVYMKTAKALAKLCICASSLSYRCSPIPTSRVPVHIFYALRIFFFFLIFFLLLVQSV